MDSPYILRYKVIINLAKLIKNANPRRAIRIVVRILNPDRTLDHPRNKMACALTLDTHLAKVHTNPVITL